MRRHRIIACVLVTVACALAGGTLLLTNNAKAKAPPAPVHSQGGNQKTVTPLVFFPPLPPVPSRRTSSHWSPSSNSGRTSFSTTRSPIPRATPASNATPRRRAARRGWSSVVNLGAGPQPGVVPGRSGPRRPLAYPYAAFSPVGPYFDAEFAIAWVGGNFWDGRVPDLSTQAQQPLINPDEMNNTPTNGVYPPPFGGYSALVVSKVQAKYDAQFVADLRL